MRASGVSANSLVTPLRTTVQSLKRDALLDDVHTMEEAIDESLDRRRLVMFLLAAFAAVALILAALGIYGVVSDSVNQRTREIGVRMALGARAEQVRSMVVRQGVGLCLIGLGIGFFAALALTRLLHSQLFGVTPTDPPTYVALAGLILAVAALASLIPPVRATRIDPMVALRAE